MQTSTTGIDADADGAAPDERVREFGISQLWWVQHWHHWFDEVAKSDLSKGLIEMKASEETIQNTYDQESKENEIETTTKNKNGKYKTNKPKGLDTSNAEFTSDKVVTADF